MIRKVFFVPYTSAPYFALYNFHDRSVVVLTASHNKEWEPLFLGDVYRKPELRALLLLWSLVLEPLHAPDHLALCHLHGEVAVVVVSDSRAPSSRSIVSRIEVGSFLVIVSPVMPGMQPFAVAPPYILPK